MFSRADVHHRAPNGGIMITSFSMVHAARKFAREEGLTSYKIMVGPATIEAQYWTGR